MTITLRTPEQIKAANARFDKLPKWKQRVAIARDVLKWLSIGKLKAAHTYFSAVRVGEEQQESPVRRARQQNPDASLQALLLEDAVSCNVCAKGAVFACTVARRNQVTVSNASGIGDPEQLYDKLGGLFSRYQLALMENAYEENLIDSNAPHRKFAIAVGPYALRQGGDYSTEAWNRGSKERMQAIMRNIIRNKGTFKPTKKG